MPTLIELFAGLHTIGALIGTGTITFAEVFFTKAAADDVVDHHERKYLRRMLHGLSYGVILLILSGCALMVLEYLVPNAPQAVLTGPFWAMQTLTIVIVVTAWALTNDTVSWWLGSAAILVAWWIILFIDLGFLNVYGYVELMITYIFMTFVIAGTLSYFRLYLKSTTKSALDTTS